MGAAASGFAAELSGVPIIDSHVHLFDISRPEGVPWPPKDSKIYHSASPDRYAKLSASGGVVGAVAVECSPWPKDNDWLLKTAGSSSLIVGVVGNLTPGKAGLRKELDRLHRNPLFRGFRCGNLWDYDISKGISSPGTISDLKYLASSGLSLDTANPDANLCAAMLRIADAAPDLTIVLDHVPGLSLPRGEAEANLRKLAQHQKVFAKFSGFLRVEGNRVPTDMAFYRDRLDMTWNLFAPDRLIYGSDWPNCELFAPYADAYHISREFLQKKDRAAVEKVYWKNSKRAYGWSARNATQPKGA